MVSFAWSDGQGSIFLDVCDDSAFPGQFSVTPVINRFPLLYLPDSTIFLLFLESLFPIFIELLLLSLASSQIIGQETLYCHRVGQVVGGLVAVTNSTCEAVAGEIFSTEQAEGVSTLSQHWRQQQLEANRASQDLLIYEGVYFFGMGLREG